MISRFVLQTFIPTKLNSHTTCAVLDDDRLTRSNKKDVGDHFVTVGLLGEHSKPLYLCTTDLGLQRIDMRRDDAPFFATQSYLFVFITL